MADDKKPKDDELKPDQELGDELLMSRAVREIERFGPLVSGIIILAMCLIWQGALTELATKKAINVAALYSAVFGWASIQTGFLFSVYGFIASKSDGFIAEIAASRSMEKFKNYTMRAMIIGFALTIITIPLIVTGDQPLADIRFYVSAAWFSVFAWAFAAFLRVAVNFGQIVSVRDRSVIPG